MQLNLREVAQILRVSENMVHRWIRERSLPAQELNGQYRFHHVELLEWATEQKIPFDPILFRHANGECEGELRLDEALAVGGIHYGIEGGDRESVLRRVVEKMPVANPSERKLLLQVMLRREAAGSTDLGNGIAIPHPRFPVLMPAQQPSITLCFLAKPIPFGDKGAEPVHTLFALLSPTARMHLHLLAHLAHALHVPSFLQAIEQRQKREIILDEARRLEESFHEARLQATRKG